LTLSRPRCYPNVQVRDDIHRKLPLSPTWRRLARACSRDSEAAERPQRAQQAAATELRRLSPVLVRAAEESNQPDFFGGADPNLAALASSPIDHAFVRQLAAGSEGDRETAVRNAVQRALDNQLEAQRREIRIHASLVDARNSQALALRVEAATNAANTPQLVDVFLGGEQLPTRYRRTLDLDADLRGGQ
jgi:hypothetical protein